MSYQASPPQIPQGTRMLQLSQGLRLTAVDEHEVTYELPHLIFDGLFTEQSFRTWLVNEVGLLAPVVIKESIDDATSSRTVVNAHFVNEVIDFTIFDHALFAPSDEEEHGFERIEIVPFPDGSYVMLPTVLADRMIEMRQDYPCSQIMDGAFAQIWLHPEGVLGKAQAIMQWLTLRGFGVIYFAEQLVPWCDQENPAAMSAILQQPLLFSAFKKDG